MGTVAAVADGTVTVTNVAGAAVTVVVPATATVTTPGLGGLAVGAPVSVLGTTGADGVVTAESITSRPAGG
ncbi:hypothetical protein BJF78_32115 [Pseudonocardia sp. CNS-139]|nr:hypothetical protein BJF78_32115 [Pseudonocardia sp. CNS-139]